MSAHLLYPLVHEALSTYCSDTGAEGLILDGISGFPGAWVGIVFQPGHPSVELALAPAGKLRVFVAPGGSFDRVHVLWPDLARTISSLLPRTRGPVSPPSEPAS